MKGEQQMSENTEEMKAPSLSEFVSAAILDIAAGLNDAQDKGRELGVKINPNDYKDVSSPMNIEFDLSVKSIAQSKEGTAISLKVFGLGVDRGKEGTENIESSDRIRFTLPIHYIVENRGRVKFPPNDDWNPIAGKM